MFKSAVRTPRRFHGCIPLPLSLGYPVPPNGRPLPSSSFDVLFPPRLCPYDVCTGQGQVSAVTLQFRRHGRRIRPPDRLPHHARPRPQCLPAHPPLRGPYLPELVNGAPLLRGRRCISPLAARRLHLSARLHLPGVCPHRPARQPPRPSR